MQLEKYVRNLLVDEDTQEISIPIPTEFEIDMSSRENNLSSSEGEGNSLEFQNSRHETKPSLSVNTKIHRHRQRRSQNRLLRRNVKKNGKISSIPFQQYNSLRIMVPSVASNENASRIEVVDEAVRYIKELESTLANKVMNEGGLVLPGITFFDRTTKEQVIPELKNRNSIPLDAPVTSPLISKDGIHLTENPIQIRNFVSNFVISPRQRLVQDCTEILKGLHNTTISESNNRKNRE